MYRVLYRKYRPTAFADVVGQEAVTDTLRHEVAAGRLAHAYLFTGSRGTGKTTCAKILAKAANCLHPRNGDPCNECEVCRGIDSGSVLDVVEIDAASNNGVDDIRDLRQEANFTPAVGAYRVYIIDEVHMLSTGAFNALLKTLEEPPAHVLFILATTEVHKLPATILSRCQRFDFRRIPIEAIADRLLAVAGAEDFTLEPDAARLIARLADGGMRDALSLLDQCAGVAGDSHAVTAETVGRVAGLAGRDHLFALSRAVREKDTAAALELIEQLHAGSKDMERLCDELISHFRNIMLVKSMKQPGELLTCPDQELDQLRQEAAGFTLPAVLACLKELQGSLERLRAGAARRVEMEMLFLRLTNPVLDTSPDALLRRLADLEASLKRLQAAPPAVSPAPVADAAPPVAAPPADDPAAAQAEEAAARYRDTAWDDPAAAEASPLPLEETPPPPLEEAPLPAEDTAVPPAADSPAPADGTAPFGDWPEVIAELGRKNPMMASVLKGSSAYVQGDLLLIDCQHQQFLDWMRNRSQNRALIREAAQAVTGRAYRLGPYRKAEEARPADPFASFMNHLRGSDATISTVE